MTFLSFHRNKNNDDDDVEVEKNNDIENYDNKNNDKCTRH